MAGLASLAGRFADRGLRVLVVEDNLVNQKVAVRMLERLGVRADVASNGKDAVDMWKMAPYNLIFMDCQMPVMDGCQATGEIRRRAGQGGRIPIIAMTAEADGRERCLEAGMDDFVSKPVKFEHLAAVLERAQADGFPIAAVCAP